MVKEENTERKASMVLGILSICLCWISWPATILAIVGLSIKKSEEHRTRDIALNVIGLVLSVIFLFFWMSVMNDASTAYSSALMNSPYYG